MSKIAGARYICLLQTTLIVGWCWSIGGALAEEAAQIAPANPVFAQVGDVVITRQDYDSAFAVAARQKFFHGKPPEGEIAKLQREVGDRLVNNVLLLKEAQRRGVKPDEAEIKKTIDGYDARYKTSEQWQKNKEQLLPDLKKKLEQESLLVQLETAVRNGTEPNAKQLETFYAANKDKFTEPEQVRASLILLKVDPSSPKLKWEGAREEAVAIIKRLRAGADFAALARLHSGDASAEKGGDMGYVHRGMLPTPAQEAIDQLKPGSISEPVTLLEGVAVFRVEDRRPAKLNPLASVKDRARELWLREQGSLAWNALIGKLRKDTPVRIDETRYLPLAAATSGTAIRKAINQ